MNTQRPRASRLQFSLRAVLVLLTFAAIGGWWWQKRFVVESTVRFPQEFGRGAQVVGLQQTESKRRQGWRNVVRDGPTTVVNAQGLLISEEEWRQGRRHGVYRRWDDDGELQVDAEFNRGRLVRVGKHQVEAFLYFSETDDSGTSARILRQLYSESDFTYMNQPLDEVIDDMKFTYKIPLLIDTPALARQGIPSDAPMTSNIIHGVPLLVAMIELLAPLDLACVYRHEILWITSPDSPLLDDEKFARVVSDGRSPHVDQVLAGEANFDYLDQPLNEVLDDISFRYDIKIDRELANPDAGVNSNVKGISLQSALGILSHSYRLRCVAQGDKLVVTDAEPNAPD